MLPLLLFSFFLDKLLNNVRTSLVHAQGEYPVWNDLYEGRILSQILVYGSSRAVAHVDPIMIGDSLKTSAYNLGIDGHNFRLQEFRHKILMDEKQKPKLILHSLDMFTLEKKPDLYNPDQFLPYLLWNETLWHAIDDYQGYKNVDHLLPLVRYYGKTEAIMKAVRCLESGPENNVPHRIKGFEPEDKAWNDDLAIARKKMNGYRVKLDTPSIKRFESYLENCAKKNITVVFVYSPEYYEGQNFVSNRDSIMALYRKSAGKYGLRFLDYSNDSMCLNKYWFYNSSHLNKEGAAVFTQKLIRDLKEISNKVVTNQ